MPAKAGYTAGAGRCVQPEKKKKMPCHSDYPELTNIESELTTIYNIHDDLKGEFKQFIYAHPKIYETECDKERLDNETRILCKILQVRTKSEITGLNYVTQRWWLNHQIEDYKRMVKESRQNGFRLKDYSDYEVGLIHKTDFLNHIIEDAFNKVEERFENFNNEQNAEWQINITRCSFVQVMSSFELFSELIFYKIHGKELNDTIIFKEYNKSNDFWKNTLSESFNDWISFADQFELKRYFEKYIHVVHPPNKARTYFEALETRTEIGKNLVFTINDSKYLIKILTKIKNQILEKMKAAHNKD